MGGPVSDGVDLPPFNPTLVRLGPRPGGEAQGALPGLSIPLWFDWGVWYANGRTARNQPFNPTLVRLGPRPGPAPPGGSGNFQSHFGSIGAWSHHAGSICRQPLSIPLWFDWGLDGALFLARRGVFQSHFGSIGAGEASAPTGSHAADFQSHFGSIGAPQGGHRGAIGPEHFQSHFGSIGAAQNVMAVEQFDNLLSIPLWFDWGPPPAEAEAPSVAAFNPTLVRLGPTLLETYPVELVAFNPTLVRLGRPGQGGHHAQLPPFNPTLVRLGPGAGRPAGPRQAGFQSHFGSIGAWFWLRRCCDLLELSIPLWFDWGAVALGDHGDDVADPFNPTLVRLGPEPPPRGRGGRRAFNPTLVRLGRAAPPRFLERLSGFQSHFGSIGACPASSPWRRPSRLSIPLWFDWGAPGALVLRRWPPVFQSHFGSIGALVSARQVEGLVQAFNPTLVRLGREKDLRDAYIMSTLSIPLWFDWGTPARPAPVAACRLSIPLWFDWGYQPPLLPEEAKVLSIPLWFDWGLPPSSMGSRSQWTFNPTLVRLGPGAASGVGGAAQPLSPPAGGQRL